MGVPISFLSKHSPEQFEIIGLSMKDGFGLESHKFYDNYKEIRQDGSYTGSSGKKTNGNPMIAGKPKKGNYYIDEKGNIKKMPKTEREWQQFSLLEAFFIKMRNLLNPRLANLSEFRKLGFGDFLSRYSDRIKLQGVNSDFKMRLTAEIMNKMFNISPDDKITF
mgnify:CR=1 FL=1